MAGASSRPVAKLRNLRIEAAFAETTQIVGPGLLRRKPRGARAVS